MSIKILMPALSPTMTEGILQKWLVKVGDNVKAGDVLAEIETDKATMEVEAVDEGKITKILVNEGTEGVAINTVIAVLDGSTNNEEKNQDKTIEENESECNNKKENIIEVKNVNIKDSLPLNKSINKKNIDVKISPFAKKMALDNNINLNSIKGSGPKGRIIQRDIEKINIQKKSFVSSSEFKTFEPSSMRKIIAEKTTETKNTIPHFYLTIESKVDKLLKLRKIINKNNFDIKISINDILVKALALAQKNNPETNVSWIEGKIIQYTSVDVSIAVALKEGIITPIVKNADKKGLLEISKEINILSKKAKEGKLTPAEYTGGTISISNLGMFGISEFAAIINPPQSSILAVGSIQKNPKIDDKKIKIMNTLKTTLSADHRVLDGVVAAKLLNDFNDIIENPFDLWLQSKDMEII